MINRPDVSRNKPLQTSFWMPTVSYRPWIYLLLILLGIALTVKQCRSKSPPPKPSFPVVSATAQRKDVPVYLSALGNVVPTHTVTVKTQINGLLMKVHYKEGQWVKAGDLLAEIDQRPLLAQLTQYRGQLLRDQALLANALIDLKRYQRLWKQDSIAQQTLATQESLVKQYQGAIETDEGLIESTQVKLLYTRITSPMEGRVGLRLIDPGNVVHTTDTSGIVVVTSLHPITVIFSLPEDDIPSVLSQIYAHKKISVQAFDRNQNRLLASGHLLTMDNQINTSTGTVNLRAQFDNKDNALFPNQFVNIKLRVKTLSQATMVPTAAIQYGTKTNYVYVIQPNLTVVAQSITTGLTSGDDTVITSGLKPGQQVVIAGADKLSNGATVLLTQDSNRLHLDLPPTPLAKV